MKIRLRNGTTQNQQIHFIDGSVQNLSPGKVKDIDPSKIYREELERVSSILTVVEKAKQSFETPVKDEPKESSSDNNKSSGVSNKNISEKKGGNN